jgi:hypothetical protein
MNFLLFLFLWVIFALLDPDPDPATRINANPDPKPWSPDMNIATAIFKFLGGFSDEKKTLSEEKKHSKLINHVCIILSLAGLLLTSILFLCRFFLTGLLVCFVRWRVLANFLVFVIAYSLQIIMAV